MKVALACVFASISVFTVHAQPIEPTASLDKPAAMQLFDEGRALLESGRADEACKKFEQSIRKDPRAVGTLLNLGLCNERLGKVATALALFVEAYDRANESDQVEQRAAAEEHIKTLRPQVPFIAIKYASAPIDGEKLVVDDRVVGREDKELALDPGPHNVVFTAPGRLPHEATVVAKVSTRTPLELPALATPAKGGGNPRRLAGKVVTGGGGALLLGAGVLALLARRNYDAQFEGSMPNCGASPPLDGREVCNATGAAKVADAQSLARTATIVGAIGAGVAIVGITLWLTAPGEKTRLVPTASATGGGVALVGRF